MFLVLFDHSKLTLTEGKGSARPGTEATGAAELDVYVLGSESEAGP